jgi:1,4-dihydroxy-2-naphthoyl-CoA hydrolase
MPASSHRLFAPDITLGFVNKACRKTMVEHIGIEFTQIGPDFMSARMPVDHRTIQPLGLLHGGASVSLAETLGSMAGWCCVNRDTHDVVGIEINANHLRGMRSGYVYGTTTPVHLGRTTQVWEIRIRDEKRQMVCISRLTLAVIDKSKVKRRKSKSLPARRLESSTKAEKKARASW